MLKRWGRIHCYHPLSELHIILSVTQLNRMEFAMKKRFMLIIGLAAINVAHATQCSNPPKVIKPMQNWDIIATNTGTIATATIFNGDHLTYSIAAHPKNTRNKVTINKITGIIQVNAEKKDDFDITVKAKNLCGTVSNKFNVIIDEEE
jgi:hypothetical protein